MNKINNIINTIKQFVNENKIILDVFLRQFSKIGLHDLHHFKKKLKDHSSVHILPCDGGYPNIATLCMKKARSCDVRHRRAHQTTRVDHVHAKCIDTVAAILKKKDNPVNQQKSSARIIVFLIFQNSEFHYEFH